METNDNKIADCLRKERFTTKEDLLEWIDDARNEYKNKAKTDKKHSAAFYNVLDELLQRFKDKIKDTVLFDYLENYWFYALAISSAGARLYLQHASECELMSDGKVVVSCDQEFMLLNCKTKLLTVEEYASLYGVIDGTVRQWIRRGKIRDAIKAGREWMIPELSEMPRRGYSPAVYMWSSPLSDIPEKFEFLKDYSTVLINQDTLDKNMYHIICAAQGKEPKSIICDTRERERIELILISNPEIISVGMPDNGLNIEISKKNFDDKI